jgi:hypothetical protein
MNMSENVTSNFPKMGDEGIPSSVVNLSARPSPYTEPQPRHRSGGADIPGAGDKANRGSTLIHNAQGPAPCKFATLYEQNAAVATEGQKNVRLMPRYAGDGGFWAKRAGD